MLLKKLLGILFLLFASCYLMGQSGADLLKKGQSFYDLDQVDSARIYYQLAWERDDPAIQLLALNGLVRVAILSSAMQEADSLLQIGDNWITNQSLPDTLVAKFQLSKGEYLRANSQYDLALAQHKTVARDYKDNPQTTLIYADAIFYQGLTFQALGVYDSSLIYVEKAYDIYQTKLDTNALKFAEIYNGLGNCNFRVGQFEEAKFFYLKSKRNAENRLGPINSDVAICLNNLSIISRTEADYETAIDYSQQAIRIYRVLKNENGLAGAYYNIGVFHYFLGDYGRCKDYMEACIEIRERLFNPTHASLIGAYEVLGIALEESGNYQQTLQFLRKARLIIIKNLGPTSLMAGFNYENTGIAFQSLKQLDSAQYYLKKANQILPQELPANDYSLATLYFSLATIAYLKQENQSAQDYLNQSNLIMKNLSLEESSDYAQNLTLVAKLAAETEDWVLGDQSFARALEIIQLPEAMLSDEEVYQLSPSTLKILNEYSDYLYKKYVVLQEKSILQAFQENAQMYLLHADRFRKQFNDPYTKSALIKDGASAYKRLIGINAELFQETKNPSYLDAVFNFSEYGRATLLRDLQDDKIRSYAGIPDSILVKEAILKKAVSEQYEASIEDPSQKQSLFAAKEALNNYMKQTLEQYPRYYDLKFRVELPGRERIQQEIPAQTHWVEYMQDDTAYYALILGREQMELVHLGAAKQIDDWVKRWKQAIQQQDFQLLDEYGFYLAQKIWEPVQAYLDQSRVVIIPSGTLFYLNFETLPSDASAAHFVIEDYNISYGLSMNLLLAGAGSKEKGKLLAIAPGFEDPIKKAYQESLDSLEEVDELYLQTVRQPWSVKLANTYKQKFKQQALIGLDANEQNIKERLSAGHLLYFGTHAIANNSDPLRSKLLLSKNLGAQIEDGYLHAYEIYGIPLSADLAVLNACESGLGGLQAGEGMISLAYSIHYAGCPSTVMSLWKVDEKISTQITADFLDNLGKGFSKSEALREAKLAYLRESTANLKHPFYWGGMVLMGQDNSLEISKNNNFRIWSWLLILLLGAFVAYLFRSNRKA